MSSLVIDLCLIATTDSSVETPFDPGFMRPTPPLHRVDDEVGIVMVMCNFIVCAAKVTWLNPAGGQFDIKWDVAMCSHYHGNTGDNSTTGGHLQSMIIVQLYCIGQVIIC